MVRTAESTHTSGCYQQRAVSLNQIVDQRFLFCGQCLRVDKAPIALVDRERFFASQARVRVPAPAEHLQLRIMADLYLHHILYTRLQPRLPGCKQVLTCSSSSWGSATRVPAFNGSWIVEPDHDGSGAASALRPQAVSSIADTIALPPAKSSASTWRHLLFSCRNLLPALTLEPILFGGILYGAKHYATG